MLQTPPKPPCHILYNARIHVLTASSTTLELHTLTAIHEHTHTYKVHCSHCPSRTPYRTSPRGNVAHKPSRNYGRTPRPVGSTQTSQAQDGYCTHAYRTRTHKRTHTSVHAQAPYEYCTHAYCTHTHIYTRPSAHIYMATAIHAQFEVKWAQLVTLAGHPERSAQIPLQALIAIGREVQTTLDQCERLASKSPELEGEHEVVADLVIGYDLAMAQNQPKLTADWFTLRMSATYTPARPPRKTGHAGALVGKDSY